MRWRWGGALGPGWCVGLRPRVPHRRPVQRSDVVCPIDFTWGPLPSSAMGLRDSRLWPLRSLLPAR